MKINDKKELHAKSSEELKKRLREEQDAFILLQFDQEQRKLKNTRELFNKRKEIAVLQTIIKTKEEVKNG